MHSVRNEEELKLYKCLTNESYVFISIRGSASMYVSHYMRSANRYWNTLSTRDKDLGFRCVKEII